MAEIFKGYVRKIDFEPKQDYLESHVYAHVFLDGTEVNFYTDNPRFEAAFLTAFSLAQVTQPPNRAGYIEIHYENVNGENKVVRVALEEKLV